MRCFRKNTGKPINLCEIFPISILNSLWHIMTGEKFSLHDPLPRKIYTAVKKYVSIRPKTIIRRRIKCLFIYFHSELSGQDVLGFLYFLPRLSKLLPNRITGIKKAQAAVDGLQTIIRSVIEEHRQRFVPGSIPNDYIDTYLQQIEDTDDPKSSFYKNEGGIIYMTSI